jgi:two-component system CheB/CheR fusion protein
MPREPDRPDEDAPEAVGATSGIPVVGLGGSAGALESFKGFFTAMPPDSGAAFVVIQHLAPAHESLLTELLAQFTRMRVAEARDRVPVEPNCVYVIPPNHYLGLGDGVLYLVEPIPEHGIRMPIDYFFRSLAEDRQERAVSILFSGAGSDGTLGVRAVRGAGGLTIAQDQTAQFGEMPRSAVATGLVDLVLAPAQMPQALTDYLRQPYVRGGEPRAVVEAEGQPGGFSDILGLILAQTGCDFRCYKKSTILRRIERRMGLRGLTNLARYTDLLRQDANEVNQLRKDLLINVTAFFRDAEAFEELRLQAVAPLVAAKQTDEPLRVWVPGCSLGEEAYSVAMLLVEEVAAARKNCPVQLFATDIDEEALQFARAGLYSESIVADVGANRLARYFIRKDQGYQVSELLRNAAVFADQNLITDPPFSKLDLISCRNLLIYLDTETQAKLIPLFNFALNPGGYLFLGKSEGVCGRHDLFDTISKKARLYRRLTPARPITLDTPILPGRKRALPAAGPAAGQPLAVSYADSIRQVLLSHFAASVVLVDRRGQILQFHGQTGKYLNLPMTEPSLNLLEIAKEGLSLKLRAALHQAANEGKPVVMESVPLTREQGAPFARVTVAPLVRRGEAEPLLAVIFEDIPRPAPAGVEPVRSRESETAVQQLEDELRVTQQDLQSTIGDLQASNEELRVANEEVVSSNEELQSTNEELETSKEELQSVNEELTTVNSQLQEKVERLAKAQADMANFLESAQIATLFLDRELRIKLFTPATTRLLKLIPSDTGRPVSDLSMSFLDYDLPAEARAVAQEGAAVEREVTHADGSVYLVRVLPYQGPKGRVDGVVVTFGDVTRLRRAEQQTRRLATAVTDSNDAVILVDLKGDIQAWNRGAERVYGWSEAEALRMNLRDLTPPDKRAETAGLMHQLGAGETTASLETQRLTKDGRTLDVWLTTTAVRDEAGKIEALATTERDITEHHTVNAALQASRRAALNLMDDAVSARRQAEQVSTELRREVAERERAERELTLLTEELKRSNGDLEQFAYVASHDLREPLRAINGFVQLLGTRYADKLDEKGKEYIQLTADGTSRMDALLNGLLNYSRVQTHGKALAAVPAGAAFRAALANLHKSISEAQAVITSDELPTVKADDSQLMQVFQNLLGNAVKFRGEKEPQIHVGCQRQERFWQFSVRDNGIGIDPQYHNRVFAIFQRLHTRGEYPGYGIGLSICKRIVERHGGRIWVESQLGQGATFYFTIPL